MRAARCSTTAPDGCHLLELVGTRSRVLIRIRGFQGREAFLIAWGRALVCGLAVAVGLRSCFASGSCCPPATESLAAYPVPHSAIPCRLRRLKPRPRSRGTCRSQGRKRNCPCCPIATRCVIWFGARLLGAGRHRGRWHPSRVECRAEKAYALVVGGLLVFLCCYWLLHLS